MTTVRRHWPLLLLLVVATAFRAAVMATYRPAFLFPDSMRYLRISTALTPDPLRPSGYSFVLAGLAGTHRLAVVVLIQHVLALCVVGLLYAVVVRRTGRRWLATLAAVPVALDAHQVDVEHYILSDALFAALLAVAMIAVVWGERLTWRTGAVAGLALGLAATVRTQGWPVAVVVAVLLLLRRDRLPAVLAFALAAAIPIGAYVSWFASVNGHPGVTASTGRFLYSRIAPFATCEGLRLTADERKLCDPRPPAQRPAQVFYAFNPQAPSYPFLQHRDGVLLDFARTWIFAHPATYAGIVLQETGRYFAPPGYAPAPTAPCSPWFQLPPPEPPLCPIATPGPDHSPYPVVQDRVAHPAGARALSDVGRFAQTPGPLLGLLLAFAVVVAALPRRVVARTRLRADGAVCAVTALAFLLLTSAAAQVDPRFGLPVLTLIPLGAALAFGALRPAGGAVRGPTSAGCGP